MTTKTFSSARRRPSSERFATVCNYVQHFKAMPRYSERVEAFCCWGDNPQREGEVNVYAKEAPFSFSRKQEEQSHFYSCRNSAYFHPFAIRTTYRQKSTNNICSRLYYY